MPSVLPDGSVELVQLYEVRAESNMVGSYCPDTDCECEPSAGALTSTLALRGTGRVEEVEERVGLTLEERPPFNRRFTSSSSVHRVEGEALWRRTLISLSLLWLRPRVDA